MSRLISKLPEPIRALAEKRMKEQGISEDEDAKELYYAFIWDETPERHMFWSQINDGDYSVFYNLYPQLEKLDELIVWMEDAIKSCEQQEKIFNETEMELSAHCSGAMATAYKQAIIKAKEIKNK